MANLSSEKRQELGCGFEPLPTEILRPFCQPASPRGYSGPAPTVCPGYSTSLPEVLEIARGHTHWKVGSLRDYTGDRPSAAMMRGLEIFAGAVGELERAVLTPFAKGGFAEDR